MKRIKTSVARALEKGKIKVGDEVWVKAKAIQILKVTGSLELQIQDFGFWTHRDSQILITKPEPKPIDFGAEGRLLISNRGTIVKTTGFQQSEYVFSAFAIKSDIHKKGECSNNWTVHAEWQDITDTYRP